MKVPFDKFDLPALNKDESISNHDHDLELESEEMEIKSKVIRNNEDRFNNDNDPSDLEGDNELLKFLPESNGQSEREIKNQLELINLQTLNDGEDIQRIQVSKEDGEENDDDSKNFKKEKQGWRSYGGIIFGLTSSMCFSLAVVIAKVLSLNSYHPFNISMWRHIGLLYPSLPLFLFFQCRWPREKRVNIFLAVLPLRDKNKRSNFLGLLCRAILGGTSVIFRFAAIQYLSVADSAVIVYSGPVFVIIVAHFCLGEKCGVVSILVAILTTLGVLVIVRPPVLTGKASFDGDTMIGACLSLMSMICKSTGIIVTRKIREVHSVLMLLTHGTIGALESLFVATLFDALKLPHGLQDSLLLLLVLPILVFLGQLSIILALKFEKAGPVSLIRTCDVIFSFIWQFAFLSVIPDIFSLLGALIVITGVCIQGLRKWLSTLPKDNSVRIKLSVLLL